MSKIDEATIRWATIRWASTLYFGLMFIPINAVGVWGSRRSALDINGIELTPWWFLFALVGPLLAVAIAIFVPSSNWIWQGSWVYRVLLVLLLVSFLCNLAMYDAGGFR